MTTVNEDTRTETPRPAGRERLAGLRELGTRQVGGVPMVGVALAILFVAVVAIALVAVAPSTPSVVSGAGAQAPTPTAPVQRAAAVPPPADPFISGTTAGAVTISWRPPRPLPVGYRVYRATGRYQPYTIVGTVNAPDINYYTDEGDLTPGTTYLYTVTAFDGQNESAPTGPVVAVLLPAPQQTATTTTQPLAPLPTLAPISAPTLTAIARIPKPAGTSPAAPGAPTAPGLGANPTPAVGALPTSGIGAIATPPAAGSTPAPISTPLAGVPSVAAAATLVPGAASTPLVGTPAPVAGAPTSAPAVVRPNPIPTVRTTKQP